MSDTPEDLLDQLDALTVRQQVLLSQLRAQVVAPPPEPEAPLITTSAELAVALQRGGTIRLARGIYTGNFTIAVPTTLLGAEPPVGRVTPGMVEPYTLLAGDAKLPALTITGSDVVVCGVTVTGCAVDRTTVIIGSGSATELSAQPHNVGLDQVAVLAIASGGHRGIEAHGVDIRLTNSHVAGYLEQGRDSQAFWSNNGPGPYTLINNFLEASGENVMFGGDAVRIPNCVPSDIAIKGNTLFKRQEWRTKTGSVKNSFELKNAQRVLFEDNVLDGCWRDGQTGNLIVLTPRNQYGGAPWTIVQDIVIRGNRSVHHTDGYAVNILGLDNNNPSQQTRRITIDGNLFQDSVKGIYIGGGCAEWLKVANNTLPGIKWNLCTFEGRAVLTPLTWDEVVAVSGDFGINSSTHAPGVPTLTAYTSSLQWSGNVIEKTPKRAIAWPVGTTLLEPGALASKLDATYHYPGAGW